jgi:hypothetical protein
MHFSFFLDILFYLSSIENEAAPLSTNPLTIHHQAYKHPFSKPPFIHLAISWFVVKLLSICINISTYLIHLVCYIFTSTHFYINASFFYFVFLCSHSVTHFPNNNKTPLNTVKTCYSPSISDLIPPLSVPLGRIISRLLVHLSCPGLSFTIILKFEAPGS